MNLLGLLTGGNRNSSSGNLFILNLLLKSGMLKYTLIAAVFVIPGWTATYYSGLTPALGTKSGASTNMGISTSSYDRSFGIQKFWLFEGQTAYMRYDVSWKNETTAFRIHPLSLATVSKKTSLAVPNPVKRMRQLRKLGVEQIVDGTGSGMLVYVVPKSGFYQFYTDRALGKGRIRRSASKNYSVSWGAYFGEPPAEILAAANNNGTVAKAPKRRKERQTSAKAKAVPVKSKPKLSFGKLRTSL